MLPLMTDYLQALPEDLPGDLSCRLTREYCYFTCPPFLSLQDKVSFAVSTLY